MKFILTCLLIFSVKVSAQETDQIRAQRIVEALNASPNDWIEPIKIENVKIKNGMGRVDVNTKAKFSYYIFTESPQQSNSKITLIPMATSRYTPTYYQTDEWWDEHKSEIEEAKKLGKPMTRQNMDEVMVWLNEMKLSTNPNVFIIENGNVLKKPLQEFLLDHYLKYYEKDGFITLYRGGEKPGEYEAWKRGETPKGVRYWTPTAAYAWRYARKNSGFLKELIEGKAPLFQFRIPTAQFKAMIQRQWQQLTLGTELTKKVHDQFDSSGEFRDQLTGGTYLGEGRYGVEFEIRSNRAGAQLMAQYFQGSVSIQDYVRDRILLVNLTAERKLRQNPENEAAIKSWAEARKSSIRTEGQIIELMQNRGSTSLINELFQTWDTSKAELSGNDFQNLKTVYQQMLPSWGLHCGRLLAR